MSPSPTPSLPPVTQIDITALRPTNCCGRGPYSVNGGPWRCGCGKDVPAVFARYVPEEAFDALLSLVVEKAPVRVSLRKVDDARRFRAVFGEWEARAQSEPAAREALKDVIRAALIEQTGGADAD